MIFVQNVNLNGLSPQIISAIYITDYIYRINNVEMVVTSAKDGTHSKDSLHYSGNAFDTRIKNITGYEISGNKVAVGIFLELQTVLLPLGFDVVLEENHIHIEYDPK